MSSDSINQKPITEQEYVNLTLQGEDSPKEIGEEKRKLLEELKNVSFARVELLRISEKNLNNNLLELQKIDCVISVFTIPPEDSYLYVEVTERQKFEEVYVGHRYEWLTSDEFVKIFCNIRFSHLFDPKEQAYARLHLPPYENDVCEILDVKENLKEAYIRVIPRVDIPKLNMSVNVPTPFSIKAATKANLPLQEEDIHISFSNFAKVARGYMLQDSYFEGKTTIMKVSVSNLLFNTKITSQEKKSLGERIVFFTHSRRDASKQIVDTPPKETDKAKKRIKSETEKEAKAIKDEEAPKPARRGPKKDTPPKPRGRKPNPNKQQQKPKSEKSRKKEKQELEEEEEDSTESSESSSEDSISESSSSSSSEQDNVPHAKKSEKVVKQIQPQRVTKIISGKPPKSVTLQYSLDASKGHKQSQILDIPVIMRSFTSHATKPEIYSMVELPTREVAVVTHKDDKCLTLLIFTNRSISMDLNVELPIIPDDNSVHDRIGRRVFPGDVVFVKSGENMNYQGIVTHTKNNRIFGELSLSGDVKPIWASGREIILIEDDLGPVEN